MFATIFMALIIVPTVILVAPKHAAALGFVPVAEIPGAPAYTANSLANVWEKIKDAALDTAVWIFAKGLIKQITADVVGWINNGFEGNPAFISDPGQFFLDVGDRVAGDFIYGDSDLRFLCDPLVLGIDIRASLGVKYFGSFKRTSSCTLSKVLGNIENARAFVNGSINGQAAVGWQSWLAMTQVPQNNFYGAYAKAESDLSARVAGSKQLNAKVADWGQGFKSFTQELTGGINKIITPGGTVAESLYAVLPSDVYALEAADELGEMINSIVGALVGKVLEKGLATLGSNTNSNSFASQLRNSDPARFATIPPSYTTVNQNVDQQTQQAAQTIINNTTVNFGDTWPAAQEAKVSLRGALATQNCTDQRDYTSNGADSAIDGTSSTNSNNTCTNTTSWWWQVVLLQSEFLDEVRLYARDTSTDGGLSIPTSIQLFGDVAKSILRYTITPATGAETQGFVLPDGVKTLPIRVVYMPSQQRTREVELYRHLLPEINAGRVPTTIATAEALAGFDPKPPAWIDARYYELWSEPPVSLPIGGVVGFANSGVKVLVTNNQSPYNVVCTMDQATCTLNPGTYKFEYKATDPLGFKSATTTKNITVPSLPVTTP